MHYICFFPVEIQSFPVFDAWFPVGFWFCFLFCFINSVSKDLVSSFHLQKCNFLHSVEETILSPKNDSRNFVKNEVIVDVWVNFSSLMPVPGCLGYNILVECTEQEDKRVPSVHQTVNTKFSTRDSYIAFECTCITYASSSLHLCAPRGTSNRMETPRKSWFSSWPLPHFLGIAPFLGLSQRPQTIHGQAWWRTGPLHWDPSMPEREIPYGH